jgi:hypothetical protein
MSATNRGSQRIDDDWYETPAWCTRAILRELRDYPQLRKDRPRVLDPAAGRGAILDVVRQEIPEADCRGFEIDPARAAESHSQCADALTTRWPLGVDLVLANYPFSLAMEFVKRAEDQAPHVLRCALLRLGFLSSQERAQYHRDVASRLYILDRRPSFATSIKCIDDNVPDKIGCGWKVIQELRADRPDRCPSCKGKIRVTTSDSSDYMWTVQGPGVERRWSILNTRGFD